MRKEDINRIFEGATDEQVKALLDINSADITKALGKQKSDGEKVQADLDAANAALAEARATIANLEAAKGDTDKLQKELDEYKAADEKRKADEKAAAERAELMERMDAVLGDKQFIHERMRDIVAEDFKAALADKANRGNFRGNHPRPGLFQDPEPARTQYAHPEPGQHLRGRDRSQVVPQTVRHRSGALQGGACGGVLFHFPRIQQKQLGGKLWHSISIFTLIRSCSC